MRDATAEEASKFAPRPGEVELIWGKVIEENGEVVGHGFLSKIGEQYWAHDLAHWGTDKNAVARLILSAKRFLQSEGAKELYTEVNPEKETFMMYAHIGFQIDRLVLKGDI